MGYHADPVTIWEMTPDQLADKKVLILAGTVPIAPEAQDAIREYVSNGGTVVAFYSAAGRASRAATAGSSQVIPSRRPRR